MKLLFTLLSLLFLFNTGYCSYIPPSSNTTIVESNGTIDETSSTIISAVTLTSNDHTCTKDGSASSNRCKNKSTYDIYTDWSYDDSTATAISTIQSSYSPAAPEAIHLGSMVGNNKLTSYYSANFFINSTDTPILYFNASKDNGQTNDSGIVLYLYPTSSGTNIYYGTFLEGSTTFTYYTITSPITLLPHTLYSLLISIHKVTDNTSDIAVTLNNTQILSVKANAYGNSNEFFSAGQSSYKSSSFTDISLSNYNITSTTIFNIKHGFTTEVSTIFSSDFTISNDNNFTTTFIKSGKQLMSFSDTGSILLGSTLPNGNDEYSLSLIGKTNFIGSLYLDGNPFTPLSTSTTFSGDLSGTYSSLKIGTGVIGSTELSSTTVTPGDYTLASITIDSDGRITSASSGSGIDADGENTAGSLTVNSYIQLSPTQENSIRLVNDSGVISVLKFTNTWINTGSLLMAEVDTLDTILNRGATSNVSILLGSSPFPGSSSDKLRVAGTGSFTNLKSSTITSTTSNFTTNYSTTLYSTYIRGASTSSGPTLYTGSGNILISGVGSFIIGGLNGVVQSFATYISGSTGFIGIGKQADSIHSLDTNGSIRAASIVLTNNPGAGKVLTSNETGVATWETPATSSDTSPIYFFEGTTAAELQTLIDTVSAAGGGCIMLKAVTYNFTTASAGIQIPSGVSISGCGRDKTILDFSGVTYSGYLLGIMGPNVGLKGFKIQDDGGTGETRHGIDFPNVLTTHTENILIEDFEAFGIEGVGFRINDDNTVHASHRCANINLNRCYFSSQLSAVSIGHRQIGSVNIDGGAYFTNKPATFTLSFSRGTGLAPFSQSYNVVVRRIVYGKAINQSYGIASGVKIHIDSNYFTDGWNGEARIYRLHADALIENNYSMLYAGYIGVCDYAGGTIISRNNFYGGSAAVGGWYFTHSSATFYSFNDYYSKQSGTYGTFRSGNTSTYYTKAYFYQPRGAVKVTLATTGDQAVIYNDGLFPATVVRTADPYNAIIERRSNYVQDAFTVDGNLNVGYGDLAVNATTGVVSLGSTPVYADNAAALAGGLVAGDIYRTATGEIRIVI